MYCQHGFCNTGKPLRNAAWSFQYPTGVCRHVCALFWHTKLLKIVVSYVKNFLKRSASLRQRENLTYEMLLFIDFVCRHLPPKVVQSPWNPDFWRSWHMQFQIIRDSYVIRELMIFWNILFRRFWHMHQPVLWISYVIRLKKKRVRNPCRPACSPAFHFSKALKKPWFQLFWKH